MNQWFFDTPQRALLEAYKAAQEIRNIEIEYFGSQKISVESASYTENVMSYWQGCLNRNLTIIKLRLAEFKLSRSVLNIANTDLLEKLKLIDEVTDKYTSIKESLIPNFEPTGLGSNKVSPNSDSPKVVKLPPVSQKTGVIPRSIGRAINKIQTDLTPQAEEEFVRNYRISKSRTRTAFRFIMILIIVPLLTQRLSKLFVVSPILEHLSGGNFNQIFINSDMETEALSKLKIFKEQLRFEGLITQAPLLSYEEVEKNIKEKAIEIAEEFRSKSRGAISNTFADLISLTTFGIIIANSKREIVIVKAFMDNVVYGLSDSAKAFLIILFTDIFVGFHSPHGWEVLLEGVSEHFGLPANRSGIFLFIATFPVILNTIVKYWIFRYLSRLSPSALATLKEMDE